MRTIVCNTCSTSIEVRPWLEDDPTEWPRFYRCPGCRRAVIDYPPGSAVSDETPRPHLPADPRAIAALLEFVLSDGDLGNVTDLNATDKPNEIGSTDANAQEEDLPPVSPTTDQDRLFKPGPADSTEPE